MVVVRDISHDCQVSVVYHRDEESIWYEFRSPVEDGEVLFAVSGGDMMSIMECWIMDNLGWTLDDVFEGVLDDSVNEIKSDEADEINHRGVRAQLDYLISRSE